MCKETINKQINFDNFKPITITFKDDSTLFFDKTIGMELVEYRNTYDFRFIYTKKDLIPNLEYLYENSNCDIIYLEDKITLFLIDKGEINDIKSLLETFNLIDKTSDRDIYFNHILKEKEELNLDYLNDFNFTLNDVKQITYDMGEY